MSPEEQEIRQAQLRTLIGEMLVSISSMYRIVRVLAVTNSLANDLLPSVATRLEAAAKAFEDLFDG